MKDLLTKALAEALVKLDKQTPTTRYATKSISISDIKPAEIVEFMKANNVPDDAYFDQSYDEEEWSDDIMLTWRTIEPTTDKERLAYRKRAFSHVAFTTIYKTLAENGYKRVSVGSWEFKKYDGTTIYEMYLAGEIDRLIEYYSLYFKTI